MRARGARIQELLLGLALLAGLVWSVVAKAGEVGGVQLAAGATGTRAELVLPAEVEFRTLNLADPHRLVVDLPGTTLPRNLRLPAPTGLVKAVRSGQPQPGTSRIVFDLHQPVVALKPRFEPAATGVSLVLEWPDDGEVVSGPAVAAAVAASGAAPGPAVVVPTPDPVAASNAATSRLIAGSAQPGSASGTAPAPASAGDLAASSAATSRLISEIAASRATPPATSSTQVAAASPPAARPATPPATPPQQQPQQARAPQTASVAPVPPLNQAISAAGTRPLVIAIDAGHGGQDPGAVGPTGQREKDITLAIARELARQVDATPGLKSYLTRDRDQFLPLNRRTQLAREAGADMFISIHADAAPNRNAKGSSVYVLSLRGASSQRARWLADKENAADLIGGVRLQEADGTLASVLLDLTQSGQMKASEDAGQHVLAGLKRIGNNHKPHIERANFAVLRTSDMPAMLVETAFLSNAEEEQRLIDPRFQSTVARAVLDGVNTYFSNQPPPGTLYAARAAAAVAGNSGQGGSP
ncbi:N-acetylmuramoyl-L-alanine amidase [Luteimonas yindakuii]|uniref:N-acetylmuramoyl-L-alanine amidase AmiC n=1 Tax=Luteimonas yindakuii TaxID=2565782 RepID=A0A4Z1RKZ2_9GAMM|nr:N-acetylmuramoyl-L-alanine amidase [Luteimonas yindakuii]TKS54281.1 N-acetylmuramoyl-L-alanine amidase [Luteimonas yindakuii]